MRVSHLAAVATLVALLGAMFIAMGSASAAALRARTQDITLGYRRDLHCHVDDAKAVARWRDKVEQTVKVDVDPRPG